MPEAEEQSQMGGQRVTVPTLASVERGVALRTVAWYRCSLGRSPMAHEDLSIAGLPVTWVYIIFQNSTLNASLLLPMGKCLDTYKYLGTCKGSEVREEEWH